MDLFSTLTFFPLVLQIALSGSHKEAERPDERDSLKKHMALPHLIKYVYTNGTDEVIRRGKKIHAIGYVELIEYDELFESHDVLALGTAPITARRFDQGNVQVFQQRTRQGE